MHKKPSRKNRTQPNSRLHPTRSTVVAIRLTEKEYNQLNFLALSEQRSKSQMGAILLSQVLADYKSPL